MNPYAEKAEQAKKEAEIAAATEKMHVGNLIESESGKWILRRLLDTFERELSKEPNGHNSFDSYRAGIRDGAKAYRDLIVKHFGHSGIEKILKGAE